MHNINTNNTYLYVCVLYVITILTSKTQKARLSDADQGGLGHRTIKERSKDPELPCVSPTAPLSTEMDIFFNVGTPLLF